MKREQHWKYKRHRNLNPVKARENIKKTLKVLKTLMFEYEIPIFSPTEVELGLTEYFSEKKGFTGLIKERYDDFIVQEVNKEGKIAFLRSTKIFTDNEKRELKRENLQSSDLKEIKTFITPEQSNLLLKWLIDTKKDDKTTRMTMIAPSKLTMNECKTRRTKIHKWLNQRFPKLTHGTDEVGRVWISRRMQKTANHRWPKKHLQQLKFVLKKSGLSTNFALQLLSKKTKQSMKQFRFAGNKDKRAKTMQWITVAKLRSTKLKIATRWNTFLQVGNFRYVPYTKHLWLGNSKGNQFTITIRYLKGKKIEIADALKKIKENGFLNYFGIQRFGVSAIGTHELGKYVLQKRFSLVCFLILALQPGFRKKVKSDLEILWKTGEIKFSCRSMDMGHHLSCFFEKKPLDWKGGVDSLVHESRNLIIHSYQSFIFNQVVSERFRRFGSSVQAKDLVLVIDKDRKARHVGLMNVGNFTIADVILTVPGHNVIYPKNLEEIYNKLFKRDRLSLDIFSKKSNSNLCGDYRNLIRRPTNFVWTFKENVKPNNFPMQYYFGEKCLFNHSNLGFPNDLKTLLIFRFILPKSTYATMLIRELMKIQTCREELIRASWKKTQEINVIKNELN